MLALVRVHSDFTYQRQDLPQPAEEQLSAKERGSVGVTSELTFPVKPKKALRKELPPGESRGLKEPLSRVRISLLYVPSHSIMLVGKVDFREPLKDPVFLGSYLYYQKPEFALPKRPGQPTYNGMLDSLHLFNDFCNI